MTKCINCGLGHVATYKRCELFAKHREIRLIMANNNCGFKKAKDMYEQNYEGNIRDNTVILNTSRE